MTILTPRAARHVTMLAKHYQALSRDEAVLKLREAVAEAMHRIDSEPAAGLLALRPYPRLARPGRAWLHVHRYWFAFRPGPRPAITAVFWDAADIPRRF